MSDCGKINFNVHDVREINLMYMLQLIFEIKKIGIKENESSLIGKHFGTQTLVEYEHI